MEENKGNSKRLFEAFPPQDREAWEQKSSKDLKGANALEQFAWEPEEGLSLHPYYDAQDLQGLGYLQSFQNRLADANNPTGEYRHWHNIQQIPFQAGQEKEANAQALDALQNGADGVAFMPEGGAVDFSTLLKGVLLNYCSVSFSFPGEGAPALLSQYLAYAESQGHPLDTLAGHIAGGQASPGEMIALCQGAPGLKGLFISIGNNEADTPPGSFLAGLVSRVVDQLDQLTDAGVSAQHALQQCVVHWPMGTDYFGGIAALRALRLLLLQIARAYDSTLQPEDFFIYSTSPTWQAPDYQPHGDMLKNTTAAMAAIIGGCNALCVEPADYSNGLDCRIARNVSSILKEEAYLNKVVDPAAGAYFIERLTHELAQQAWKKFLALQAESGE